MKIQLKIYLGLLFVLLIEVSLKKRFRSMRIPDLNMLKNTMTNVISKPRETEAKIAKVLNLKLNPDANEKKNQACNDLIMSQGYFKGKFQDLIGPYCCRNIDIARFFGLHDRPAYAQFIWDRVCAVEPGLWKNIKKKTIEAFEKLFGIKGRK